MQGFMKILSNNVRFTASVHRFSSLLKIASHLFEKGHEVAFSAKS